VSPDRVRPREPATPDDPRCVSFDIVLTERGYRGVLLHLAALRLRFVPPALGMAALFTYGAGMRTEAIALFSGALAIPIVLWGYLAWLSRSPSSHSLYTPVRYELTVEAITYSSAEGDGRIDWDSVTRWREAAEHLLVYVTSSIYLVLPIDDLGEDTLREVEAMLADKVGPKGRRTRRLR
jgi:hypothetical protein